MSDATETTETASPADSPVRSTSSVLVLLAALVAVPVLILLVLVCLRGSDSSGAGAEFADAVNERRFQAVYMVNDDVFFGRVVEGTGDVLRLEDAFFLRRTAADDDSKDPEGSLDLVSVAQDVGGDGDLLINAGEVVRIQNLADDAKIATSIEDAIK